ncbi:hypothetical protein [Paraflavitalea speifideaquila]|uniref:hypothetical protein n=1 Tax=Paraflavitalea speifideaquila TaxID=3076558 RepID=UPI0028EE9D29|nr:hypothetical protein [Paraflavitalea speifideiaquila]
MVDEDPSAVPNPYEQMLQVKQEAFGIKYCVDEKLNNRIFILKPKLEDWIIAACKKAILI